MVLDYYNLAEQPFGVTPDPRFLYLSPTHRAALASLQYGVTMGRGITALIASPGMGKTTLLLHYLSKEGDSARTVFLAQSFSTPRELLRSLLANLGIQEDANDIGQMQRKLNECLVRESSEGRRFIVVIDEAQSQDKSVLEVVRMLSNFETPREKIMHFVLAGQPSLADRLEDPELVQLRQRISVIAHLVPFNTEETQLYIDHRLGVAGYDAKSPLFTKLALALIAKHSGGNPRDINSICSTAMSLASTGMPNPIDTDVIEEVVMNLNLDSVCKDPSEMQELEQQPAVVLAGVSSALRGWPLKFALSLGLFAALGGTITLTREHLVKKPDSLGPRVPFESSSPLSPPSPSMPTEQKSVTSARRATHAPDVTEKTRKKALSSSSISASQVSSPEDSPSGATRVVIVQPNQNIFRLCIEIIGRYDDDTLIKIRQLNPGLGDLERIKVGQKLRIPVRKRGPGAIRVVAAQRYSTTNAPAEKP